MSPFRAIEEGVRGMAQNPLALALVVVNLMFLGGGGWLLLQVANRAETRDAALIALARECAQLVPKKEKPP